LEKPKYEPEDCAWHENLASPKNKGLLCDMVCSVTLLDTTHKADVSLMIEPTGRTMGDVADPEPMEALTSQRGNTTNLALLQLGATRYQNLG